MEPVQFEQAFGEPGAERAGKVGSPFGPVLAGARERAVALAQCGDVETEAFEALRPQELLLQLPDAFDQLGHAAGRIR